jgi:sugar O-acyltransferase (sialic acid O-acetyltransferase NeuD family)
VPKKTFVLGAGGHGRVVLDILLECRIKISGFIDDDKKKWGSDVLGIPVLGGCDVIGIDDRVAVGIGSNRLRAELCQNIHKQGGILCSAIHPKASVSRFSSLAKGVVIMAGAVVNAGAVLEEGVVVNTGATVDHDCHLASYCQIWPGAHLAGDVRVGSFAYVGTGASIIPQRTIGEYSMIGAGATVVQNVPPGVTVVGVPARIVKGRSHR